MTPSIAIHFELVQIVLSHLTLRMIKKDFRSNFFSENLGWLLFSTSQSEAKIVENLEFVNLVKKNTGSFYPGVLLYKKNGVACRTFEGLKSGYGTS